MNIPKAFKNCPNIRVIDVGASPIDGDPPYLKLFEAGRAEILGFEPDEEQFKILSESAKDSEKYLKVALGDGKPTNLYICEAPGMTSTLKPDPETLSHFPQFDSWGSVKQTQKIETKRLDDVPEAYRSDYIKLDIQGGELGVLEHGKKVLQDTLCVHIEVQFVPFYEDQPLFAELDILLRECGFYLHNLLPLKRRIFTALGQQENPYLGLNQVLWSDGVYFRNFTDFPKLSAEKLLKTSLIAHELYGSYDLAALALEHYDSISGENNKSTYITEVQDLVSDSLA